MTTNTFGCLANQPSPGNFLLKRLILLLKQGNMIASQLGWRIVHSESSNGWGGQEHRVLAELAGFQRRGSWVWLLAARDSQIIQRARQANITVVPVNFSRLRLPLNALQLARWLKRERVEILNTHSSQDGWLLGVAGRLAGVPLIIRTRHIDVDYPNRWVSRHAFTTFADHVLTTSDKITRHFQEMFHLPDSRISTLPTGIDLDAFLPAGEKARLVAGVEDKPLIGMISVLRSWKGHATFLEAAAQLKSAGFDGRFVIVGEGPFRPYVEQQIRELNLGGVVSLAGHREDVPAVLRALNVLVIASNKHEGVPQIGLQALACKTPVVGSDVGGIPEIIRPGETGRIFPAQNAGALADAIRSVLNEAELTETFCRQGRELVESKYSLSMMLDQLDALYRRHIPPTA
jgi:glycosyltransferase involved in cell wall biosynthesis